MKHKFKLLDYKTSTGQNIYFCETCTKKTIDAEDLTECVVTMGSNVTKSRKGKKSNLFSKNYWDEEKYNRQRRESQNFGRRLSGWDELV
jgi:hypothetical protein